MMRRDLLQLALTAAALAPLAGRVGAGVSDPWSAAFAAALEERPWLLGYLGCEDRDYAATAQVEGAWPAALAGRLYRNGAGLHEFGDWRYRHLFDGDGLVQSWHFPGGGDGGQVRHHARLVATRKLTRERAAGRRLLPAFGSLPPAVEGITGADDLNVANISVLPRKEGLLALWEAGSPWALDSDTLATRGPVTFSPQTRGLPFSAHPRLEPDGQLWNFGYVTGADKLVLWHFGADERLRRCVVRDVPRIGIPHDFMVTARYLLIVLPPLAVAADGEGALIDRLQWEPQRATRVLVIRKSDLEVEAELELPAQWIFHHGNAFEDGSGVIRFESARAPDPGLMTQHLRELMRGVDADWTAVASRWHHYRLDLEAGTASEEVVDQRLVEFPGVLPRHVGSRHPEVVLLGRDADRQAAHGGLDQVCVFDAERGSWSSWRYPDTQLPEEHLPVAGADGSRWILGTALDWSAGRSLLNVFRLDDVAAGPVASARLPYALPLGLHGRFLAA
ncbi:MAG: carotenoid oxygenase family protein [Gammaproteobacteria bacterium]|nr:carotenoid oxygenase family protein [Gammaproteobacteria bacterium]